jgi:hypothetical protein
MNTNRCDGSKAAINLREKLRIVNGSERINKLVRMAD